MDVQHPDRGHCGMRSHGVRDESAGRGTGRDAVAMFDGHAVCHETTHRESSEKYAVQVDGMMDGQGVEEGHQESRVVDAAVHHRCVPHGGAGLRESLRYHHNPAVFVGHLLEVELVVQSGDVVAPSMQEIHDGHGLFGLCRHLQEILASRALPFKVLDLGMGCGYHRRQEHEEKKHFFVHSSGV